jgi:hypothetical protein
VSEAWILRGELALSCSCTVFCPCVLSLGQHLPTEGHCQTWAGIRIDDGRFGDVDLSGVKLGLFAEIPGHMARGNWTTALFVDQAVAGDAVAALTRIFTGQAGGSTRLLAILVGSFLGVQRHAITYQTEGETRIVRIGELVDGAIAPIRGRDAGNVTIRNSEYWIAPDITVARAEKSRLRAFGRNWNFAGRSAEICRLDWSGGGR